MLFRSWSLCPRSDFMFQKETGVAFSQSSGVPGLILSGEATQGDPIAKANPAEFLDLGCARG